MSAKRLKVTARRADTTVSLSMKAFSERMGRAEAWARVASGLAGLVFGLAALCVVFPPVWSGLG
jgi:hypothetical protein